MGEYSLHGRRILVVEDEYLIADEIAAELGHTGAEILGPAGSVEDAIALIDACGHIDGAVLDMNLRGETVFPVAERLQERDVPFVFATGYDRLPLPPRYADVHWCEKPVDSAQLVDAIARALAGDST